MQKKAGLCGASFPFQALALTSEVILSIDCEVENHNKGKVKICQDNTFIYQHISVRPPFSNITTQGLKRNWPPVDVSPFDWTSAAEVSFSLPTCNGIGTSCWPFQQILGTTSLKKMFSFSHCPNCLTLTHPIRAICTTFVRKYTKNPTSVNQLD